MAERGSIRIKVTLRWIQILDTLAPAWKEKGEFRFRARVSTGGAQRESHFPETGHYEISDHPAWNRVVMNRVLYEGAAGESLVVELMGEESPELATHDLLDHYLREFRGRPETWFGWYGPGDDVPGETNVKSTDPELMEKWRVCYMIQPA